MEGTLSGRIYIYGRMLVQFHGVTIFWKYLDGMEMPNV